MDKNKKTTKHSIIYLKSFLIIFLALPFALFFMLTLLPGCRLIFPLAAAHTENNASVENVIDNVISGVWQESVISMNKTLKQNASGSACQHADIKADKNISASVSEDIPESNLSVLALINKYDTDPYGLILPEIKSGNIYSSALFSFYSNLTEQLEIYKSKSGQSDAESQEIAEADGETGEQQINSDGQAESLEADNQDQSAQQEQDGQTEEQQAGETQTTEQLTNPPGQAAGFASVLLSLINNARNSNGVPSLSLNSTLDSIAKSRCDDMIARDYFSHVTPDGKDIQSLIEENGINYRAAGENLQYCCPPSMAGAELFFKSWMDSDTHRANILDPIYTQIGIALSSCSDKALSALVFLG